VPLGARADDDYELGHGLNLGPVNVAGYSNVVANLPEGQAKSLKVDDLSLFLSGHFGKLFNPFGEAELTDLAVIPPGSAGRRRGHGNFVLERLYNDSYLTDSITLRFGKMLSPVGEWNEIHAAPLVLSTIRPAVTFRNFSEYTTGASVTYSDPYLRYPEFKVYFQPDSELFERPENLTIHQYKEVEGAHVTFPLGLLDKVGVSFQQSKDVLGFDQSLYGLDFRYTIDKVTLYGEATYSDITHPVNLRARDIEWGAYVAASYALTDKWSVYSWYEGYADRTAPSTAHDVLFGLAYRPKPPIVFRLEYLQNVGGQPVNPTGVFASFAVLF
jgi:hypothetical protein